TKIVGLALVALVVYSGVLTALYIQQEQRQRGHAAAVGAAFDHIVIIDMENTPYSAVFGSGTRSTCPTSSAPFLCSMLPVSSTVPSMNNYGATSADGNRSEEHTSELQSRFDLVCRLLLEKKKHVH